MTERHYLVATVGAVAQLRVVEHVRRSGGFVLLATRTGALVARMTDALKDEIAALAGVRHVGGVEVSPRPIRRIRIGPGGRRPAT